MGSTFDEKRIAVEKVLEHFQEHVFTDNPRDQSTCPECGWNNREHAPLPTRGGGEWHHEGCQLRAALDVLKEWVE